MFIIRFCNYWYFGPVYDLSRFNKRKFRLLQKNLPSVESDIQDWYLTTQWSPPLPQVVYHALGGYSRPYFTYGDLNGHLTASNTKKMFEPSLALDKWNINELCWSSHFRFTMGFSRCNDWISGFKIKFEI